MPARHWPARWRALAALAGALLLAVLATAPALAHAELTTSDPADGATLTMPPTAITLTFSETLDPAKSSFKLLGPDGGTIGTRQGDGREGHDAVGPRPRGGRLHDRVDLRQRRGRRHRARQGGVHGARGRGLTLRAPASPTAPASLAPTPAPTTVPASPASSTGSDVLLPIIVGLLIVAGVGVFVLRRSRTS